MQNSFMQFRINHYNIKSLFKIHAVVELHIFSPGSQPRFSNSIEKGGIVDILDIQILSFVLLPLKYCQALDTRALIQCMAAGDMR